MNRICGLGLLFEAEVEFKYCVSVKKENKKGVNMENLFLEMNKSQKFDIHCKIERFALN